MVWSDATETTFEIVRRRPRIARGHKNICGLFNWLGGGNLIDVHEGHGGLWGEFELSLPEQVGCYTGRGSQGVGDKKRCDEGLEKRVVTICGVEKK
jgi:hypothetical protein